MKQIAICIVLLIISATSFSQQTNSSPTLTKQDYLLKSKHQKTGAWILLGGGVSLEVLGVLWAGSNFDSSGPDVLWVTGGVSILGSIPLFIASSKNKKKSMGISFKNESVPQLQKNRFVYHSIPSLSLKINL